MNIYIYEYIYEYIDKVSFSARFLVNLATALCSFDAITKNCV